MPPEAILGNLPPSWELTTLGQVCKHGGGNIQTGPFGSQLHASDYIPSGIPVVMPVNIGDNRINTAGIARISPEDAKRLSRHLLEPGDVVYSRRGDLERRALIRSHEAGWLCGTGCLRIRFGRGAIDPLFASFYLSHPLVRQWIVRHAVGATMPNLNTGILEAVPFAVPSLDEQQKITGILAPLDDKIDLNYRMNNTLEAMARAIFKSWFVDFDPMLQGHPLFPHAMQNSSLGPIPERWSVGRLDDLLLLQRGFDLPTADRKPGQYPVIAASGANGQHEEFIARGPGVVTGRSGVLGRVFLILGDFWPLNTTLWIKEFRGSRPAHAYFLLSSIDFSSFDAGSAVPTLNRNHIHNLPVVIPPLAVVEEFESLALPMFEMCQNNDQQSRNLADLRDTLLPKLLSGEIRIKQAEKIVSEAV